MTVSSDKPYTHTQWDDSEPPSSALIERILAREGIEAEEIVIQPGTRTAEIRSYESLFYILKSGAFYFGVPGYGSVDMLPGDIFEIQPDVRHDINVTSTTAIVVMKGAKKNKKA